MIVDVNYYYEAGFHKGSEQELLQALARAERIIDLITLGKCADFKNLHENAQKQLKFAICAQAERYVAGGFDDDDDAIDCKVRIGDFSYESRNNGVVKCIAPTALAALRVSGLLYMGTEAR
jgi:hypothetical protein